MLAVSGREMFGPAGAQLVRGLGGTPQAITLLVAVLLAWVAVPAAVGAVLLDRQDL
jgi:hypothetical protein